MGCWRRSPTRRRRSETVHSLLVSENDGKIAGPAKHAKIPLGEDAIFESFERFYHRYYLRPKPILHIIKTMLEDKDVCVRRLREGYEFFKSMAQRRSDLEAVKSGAAAA